MFYLTPSHWRFGFFWMLATTIAIVLCAPFGSIGLFMGPALLASAQGYVLNRHGYPFIGWSLATLVSGYSAIVLFVALFFSMTALPLVVFICGAVMGLAQGLILRRRTRYWVWWPVVSAAVLTISIAWFVPSAVNATIYGSERSGLDWLVLATFSGLIGGCLKGIALAWFLKGPASLSRK